MGRERMEYIRESGVREAEKFYILAYEGDKTEAKYFRALRSSVYFNDSGKIEIIPLKRPERTDTDPMSVKRRLSVIKRDVNFKGTDEFWLLIDRDDWETNHKISFDELVQECKNEKNFYLAMSNPCFELWLLLHFKKLSDFSDEVQSLIYENAKISKSRNYISTLFESILGRGISKKPNMNLFIPYVYTAIANAKELTVINEPYPSRVGSDVYKLVEKIVKDV